MKLRTNQILLFSTTRKHAQEVRVLHIAAHTAFLVRDTANGVRRVGWCANWVPKCGRTVYRNVNEPVGCVFRKGRR